MRAWHCFLLAVFPLFTACPSAPVIPHQVDSCAPFCEAAQALECPEGEPSPGGVPCVQWCENYHARGYLKPFSECGAAATTVQQMRACGVRCEREAQ